MEVFKLLPPPPPLKMRKQNVLDLNIYPLSRISSTFIKIHLAATIGKITDQKLTKFFLIGMNDTVQNQWRKNSFNR